MFLLALSPYDPKQHKDKADTTWLHRCSVWLEQLHLSTSFMN